MARMWRHLSPPLRNAASHEESGELEKPSGAPSHTLASPHRLFLSRAFLPATESEALLNLNSKNAILGIEVAPHLHSRHVY